ncbi:MAG: hypothetical protein ABSA82_11310, partial [Thermacetogeniaceae bacterium]
SRSYLCARFPGVPAGFQPRRSLEPAFRPGVSPDTGAHRFKEAGALERVVICGKLAYGFVIIIINGGPAFGKSNPGFYFPKAPSRSVS